MGELPLLEDSVLGALGELAAATGNHQTGREMLVRAQMMLEDAGQALERARVVCGRARVTGAAGWDALASPGRSIGPSVPRAESLEALIPRGSILLRGAVFSDVDPGS